MNKKGMGFPGLLLVLAVFLPTRVFAAQEHDAGHHHQHHHEHHGDAKSSGNPLMEEMLLLDTAFREIVSAVAVGDAGRVHKALEPMHGTMEKTHEAVHHGEVQIPKNDGKVEEFVRLDKQFHQDLESLAAAAAKNDGQAMVTVTKKLLDGCVSCHQRFRK
jgi:cytochrome c556